jgi:sugar/nucleoside kinase (ribokinase family)
MTPPVLCIGALHWDVLGQAAGRTERGDDVPGRVEWRPGGVAANIAFALAARRARPVLLSAVGDDHAGAALIATCAAAGIVTDHVLRLPGRSTGTYAGIEDAGGLVVAVADAATLEAAGPGVLVALDDGRLPLGGGPWTGDAVIDGNLAPEVLRAIAAHPALVAAGLRIAGASPAKAPRLAAFAGRRGTVLHLNLAEARVLARALSPGCSDAETAAEAAARLVALGAARAVVTDGANPVADADSTGVVTAIPPRITARRVTGAGDLFLAAHLLAERGGLSRRAALKRALSAAAAHVGGRT